MTTPYLLNHLVESAAERNAGQIAFKCRSDDITYGDLIARSERLASALQQLGVNKGDRVGILLNKSIDSIVSVFGIMGAGAAYVPIDPLAPADRVDYLVKDAGIEVLVTESRHAAKFSDPAKTQSPLRAVIGSGLEVDGVTHLTWEEMTSNDVSRTGLMEQDLCYILYTSGSTGTPKGIMHTHRSALSWANVSADVYRIGDTDVISNYAPLHFDLSTLDLYAGPRGGATVVMIPEEHMRLPASLARLLSEERLTLFYTVPMALVQLAQPGVLDDVDLSSLTRILFGGEPMPMKHLAAVSRLIPSARFYNVYGPTEVNGCTHHEVHKDDLERDSLPIGRPYPNVDFRVVDDGGLDTAPGDVGELYIRSATMMKGYWNRPDLNERAFRFDRRFAGRPDVFHPTGDYAHVDSEGVLHFHGRRDRQIKARGNRVELDEVEALLLTHESVSECAVFGIPSNDGPVSEIGASAIVIGEATKSDLRRYLAARLPSYAVPTRIEIRTEFPRTTSGKIHRRELASQMRQET